METRPNSLPNPCKFWPRIGAILLDIILLGIVGLILGLIFFDAFASIGIYGRLLGFLASVTYFGVFNSSMGGGQTPGKKACNIKVVGSDGKELGLLTSLLRSTILLIPIHSNGLPIYPSALTPLLGVILSVLLFGFGFSIFYLYIANRRTRQSLHDLVVGSFVVVRGEATQQGAHKKVNRGHYFVCGMFTFVVVIFVLFVAPSIAKKDTFAPIFEAQEKVWDLDFVSFCNVSDSTSYSNNGTFKLINVAAVTKKRGSIGREQFIKIAEKMVESYPKIEERDQLRITLSYGYDIGIARSYTTKTFADTIPNWKEQIHNEASSNNAQ